MLQKLDYHWVETGHIQTQYFVRALSWNLEGTRLLLGGRLLQLWTKCNDTENHYDIYQKNVPQSATFQLGSMNDVDSEEEGKEKAKTVKQENSKKTPVSEGIKLHSSGHTTISFIAVNH